MNFKLTYACTLSKGDCILRQVNDYVSTLCTIKEINIDYHKGMVEISVDDSAGCQIQCSTKSVLFKIIQDISDSN